MVLRTTPEKRDERDRVRLGLLRAALRLGAEHGFSSVGLREVARAASIAPTSFYRHFSDMPELALGLVDELVRPLLAQLASRVAAGGAEVTAASLVDAVFAAADADPELVRFVVAERYGALAPVRHALCKELEMVAKLALRRSRVRARASEGTPARADALLALLCDGLGRALELPPAKRPNLREQLAFALALVLDEQATPPRSP